jgi:hypothetical protein
VFRTTSDAITAAWRRIVLRAEIEDFRYHDLRHEATSRLFERGLEIMEVQRITGHKTLSMLLRYTQMNVDRIVKRLDATEPEPTPASPRRSPDAPDRPRQNPSTEGRRNHALGSASGLKRKYHSPEPVGTSEAPEESDRRSNVVAFPVRK